MIEQSFHFLTKEEDIQKYATLMNDILEKTDFILWELFRIRTLKCSGLEIMQYSKEKFLKIFGTHFSLLNSFEEVHKTPFETTQNFIFCEFQKKM